MHFRQFRTFFTFILFSLSLLACSSESDTESPKLDDTPLTIKTVPVDSQTNVPPNTELISISFSKSINPESISPESFFFTPSAKISLDTSLLVSRQLVFISILESLEPGTSYRSSIRGLRTTDGRAVADLNWQFTTIALNDTTPPTTPENLRLSEPAQTNTVSIRWDASTDEGAFSGYQIIRDNTQISFTSNTVFSDTSVNPGQTYEYQIIAIDASQNQSTSNTLSVTTVAQINVPDITGLTQTTGQQNITMAGLNIGNITTEANESVPLNNIISQNPVAGTLVNPETSVSIIVSSGSSSVTVPNLIGETQSFAESSTISSGLIIGSISNVPSSSVASGRVISQNPAASTSVSAGSSINLVISTGPIQINVPAVVGQAQGVAQQTITSAGLVIGSVLSVSSDTITLNDVISQNPTAGSSVSPGTSINLVISSGSTLVTVPDVINQTQTIAQQAITSTGLVVGNISTVSSNTVALNDVISQSPVAGSSVSPNTSVNLVISSGSALITVPDVVSQAQVTAQQTITSMGLTLGSISTVTSNTVALNDVISQNPVAGSSVSPDTSVNLVVSSGSALITVPDVVSQAQVTAQQTITSTGLVVGNISTVSSNTVALNDVISQNPVAGSSVSPDTSVNLVVSSGNALVTVPDLVGQTQSAAQTSIESLGLTINNISNVTDNTVPYGNIISQDPASGSTVTPGSSINLTISNGPYSGYQTYFISPTGNDSNNGTDQSTPWKTFKFAFERGMQAGDELVLLDGTYTEPTTGILRGVGNNGNSLDNDNSSAIPSGLNRGAPTIVRAASPGSVKIVGPTGIKPLFIGRSFRKDQFILIQGITFIGGGSLYNSGYVTIKDSGFKGSLGVGTGDHYEGNDYNLIEDVWVWAENTRIVAINYRSHNNVWRRVVVRSEGCDVAGCEGAPKADPSVGITVYDSQNISMQNIIVIDRLIRNDVSYADFATAQHTTAGDAGGNGEDYFLGNNEWLGSLSINSEDASMNFEADRVMVGNDPIWTIKDFMAIGSRKTGINIGNTPGNYAAAGSPPSLIENATIIIPSALSDVSGVRVDPQHTGVLVKNSVAVGATRTGYNVKNSTVENSASFSTSTTQGDFDTNSACTGCTGLEVDPTTDGSYLYPVKVEDSSAVANAISGVNIGASIVNRYGLNNTISGDASYNTLSSDPLWPWPNEARIKQEMCNDSDVTRGFCSNGTQLNGTSPVTLSSYIWEYSGNPIPDDMYESANENDCNNDDIHCVDDTQGATQEFATIQEAVNIVAAGETVLVYPGTYQGFRVSTSGTSTNSITIKAIDNNAYITSANNQSDNDNIYISDANYVTIDGFNVSNATEYCIGAHDASASNPMQGIKILNNTVFNCNSSNIYMSQVSDSLIENNRTYNSVNSHGIYLSNAGSDNTTIKNNTSYNNAKNGIHFNGDGRQGGDGLHTGILVDGNILYDNVANGIDADGVYDSSFINNVIYNNGRHGIRVFQLDADAGAGNLNYINNTIVSNASMGIKMTEDIGGHTLFNNILVSNANGCISAENDDISSDNNIYTDNCTFEGNITRLYGNLSTTSNLSSLFNNPSSNDYSLNTGSPAIDYSLPSFNGLSAPALDISGKTRSGTLDSGAYESN